MNVQAFTNVPLHHRNYFGVKGNNKCNRWLVGAQNGDITIFNEQGVIEARSLKHGISGIDYCPQKELIAWHAEGKMVVQTVGGHTIFERRGGYETVYFSGGTDFLWTIETENPDMALVSVLKVDTGATVASLEIVDEYDASAFSLHPGANNNHLVLYMAAGQDGQSTFFLSLENDTLTLSNLEEKDTHYAVFNPSKTSYILGGDDKLNVYGYPACNLTSTIGCNNDFGIVDDYGFVMDDLVAMAGEKSPCLLNIKTHQIQELVIPGHEPKPISFYYPALNSYDELTTDIEGLDVFGNFLIFHCRNHQHISSDRNAVLIIESKTLFTGKP